MTEKMNYSTDAFIRFVMCTSEFISSDKERAIEYLKEEGLNAEAIIADGLKRIKRLQLKINAERTRKEMISSESVNQKATEWVDKLLSDINFSFADFVKEEKLVLQNRNLSLLSKEDIRITLIQYYTLKFLESGKDNEK